MELILLTQTLTDVKDVLSIREVSVIGILIGVIIYFWWENKENKKRVEKVIEEHQKDLKEGFKDAQAMLENYHKFMEDTRKALNK